MDRHAALALIVVAAVAVCLLAEGGDAGSGYEAGIVHDVRETENGYVFFFAGADGEDMKCWSAECPPAGLAEISGRMSGDGGIFFADAVRPVSETGLYPVAGYDARCS